MHRSLTIAAALFAALGIICGAFGAHALKGALDASQQSWFDKAAHYHQLSALGAVTIAALRLPRARPGWLLLAGAALFSASLYAMALGGPRWLGAATPIGGSFMIFAWLDVAWLTYRSPRP